MLDPIAAGLLVLGLGLALWRWRDPIWMLLPLWLGGALMGGILSLDFEAPQSLRANGTMSVVYVLAVVSIFVTWRPGGCVTDATSQCLGGAAGSGCCSSPRWS
ncbi:MAG: hypothetical protein R2838_15050 [Caldilineaceae bacterium]